MDKTDKLHGKQIATEHVDWFLEIIRPLLISWFEHGYKHGSEKPKRGLLMRDFDLGKHDINANKG